jgi:hypothetical protein
MTDTQQTKGAARPSRKALRRVFKDDLLERLELIVAWKTPGGPTPEKKMPSIYKTCREAIERIKAKP